MELVDETELENGETTDTTEHFEMPELKAPLEKNFINKLTDFGELKEFPGSERES